MAADLFIKVNNRQEGRSCVLVQWCPTATVECRNGILGLFKPNCKLLIRFSLHDALLVTLITYSSISLVTLCFICQHDIHCGVQLWGSASAGVNRKGVWDL